MQELSELAQLGRDVRQDDGAEPGTPTPEAILRALEEGGADDMATVYVGNDLNQIFADGFESGDTSQWSDEAP